MWWPPLKKIGGIPKYVGYAMVTPIFYYTQEIALQKNFSEGVGVWNIGPNSDICKANYT